jgi:hypothetical protein
VIKFVQDVSLPGGALGIKPEDECLKDNPESCSWKEAKLNGSFLVQVELFDELVFVSLLLSL